jgi:hypothetical protein
LSESPKEAVTSEKGRLAQLVERFIYTEDVGGSSPSSSTTYFINRILFFPLQLTILAGMHEKEPFKPNIKEGKARTYSGIRFEPGIRIVSSSLKAAQDAKFSRGDLDAHYWNDEVASRLHEYSPRVIAIEGIGNGDDVVHQAWMHLPANIDKCTRQREIMIVAGDIDYSGTSTSPSMTKLLRETQEDLKSEEDEINAYNQFFDRASLAGAVAFVGSALAHGVGKYAENTYGRSNNSYTRRQLFKLTFASCVAALYGDPIARNIAARRESVKSTSFWQDVASATRPDIADKYLPFLSDANIVNGRTALLIAKQKDTIDYLQHPADISASLLMGTEHGFQAASLLQNDNKCTQAIAELAEATVEIAERLIISKDQDIDIVHAPRFILDTLSQVDVVNIRKNDNKAIVNPIPQMKLVASFKSQRVDEAIKHLR